MNEPLQRSQEIVSQAVTDYKPYAVVLMLSGGNDSKLAEHVAKALRLKIDFIMHGWTRTGIFQTTQHVREIAMREAIPYIEADAGGQFEKRVRLKGFYGRGRQAHSFAYHELKAGPFRSAVSRHIRQGQRNRPVLFINGARTAESANRAANMTTPVRVDSGAPNNIWVNICHDWDKASRDAFLADVKALINPVTQQLCRSGECLCGTSQEPQLRSEIAALNRQGCGFEQSPGLPWDKWLANLENEAFANGHTWGWGEDCDAMNPTLLERQGQMVLDWEPMCVSCKAGI